MDSKHVRLYQYQHEWVEDDQNEAFNLSGYVRTILDAVIPAPCIPESRLPKATKIRDEVWRDGEWNSTLETERCHVSLHPYQKTWLEAPDQSNFDFHQYVRDRLDTKLDSSVIPEQRREFEYIVTQQPASQS